MVVESMNFPGAVAALKAFQQASTGDVVSEVELMRRISICNAKPTPCPRRRKSTSIITKASQVLGVLANRNRVPRDVADYSCSVCKCSFMLLLPSKAFHDDTDEELKMRPAECWLLTDEQRERKKELGDKIEGGGCYT